MTITKRDTLSVAAISVVVLAIVGALVRPEGPFGGPRSSDADVYFEMAERGLFSNQIESHLRSRILTPLLVRMLPFETTTGFEIITFCSMLLFIVTLYRLVQQTGLSTRQAHAAILLVLSLFYPIVYFLRNPLSIDPLVVLLWTVSVLFIVQDRLVPLAAAVAVSALAKEAVLFLAPVCFYLWLPRHKLGETIKRTVIVFAPATIVFLVVRAIFPAMTTGGRLTVQLSYILAHMGNIRLTLSGILLSGGLVWLGAMLGWKRVKPEMRRLFIAGIWPMIPINILAIGESGRMLVLFLPFWLPLALSTVLPAASPGWLQALTVSAFAAGNLLLSAATVLELPQVHELGLRGLGVILQIIPIALVWRLHRTAVSPAEMKLSA
jgi:hypothetical protein